MNDCDFIILMIAIMIVIIDLETLHLSLSLLTESVQNIQAGKAGKVTGLIRVVHLLNQNKVMVSLNPITSSSLLFLSSSSISSYPSSLS